MGIRLRTRIARVWQEHWLAYLLVLLFLLSGVLTLNQYGMTWDEGLGNFFFGERYLSYLRTFNPIFLDFTQDLPELSQGRLPLFESPYRLRPHEFPAFADILSAASMELFGYGLRWLDPVEAFHLFPILLASAFLLILYHFAAHRFGRFVALLALIILGTAPRFWADMHFNGKDVPQAIFYSLTILAYWRWYEKPTLGRALAAGLCFGCALGIKANALFLLPTLVLGVWPVWDPRRWVGLLGHALRHTGHYALMAASAAVIFLASWPYLYQDLGRVKEYYRYIAGQGMRDGGPGWKLQPLEMSLATLSESMLVFLLLGLLLVLLAALRGRHFSYRLLLVWCLLPVVRISLPHMVNFDGIRHYLEFLPAAALIAALGASAAASWLARRLPHGLPYGLSYARLAVLALLALNTLLIGLEYRSFGYLYFNRFFGGMPAAEQRFGAEEATDYWGSSYRQGMAWLSAQAEPGALVYVPVAGWAASMTRALYLRPDITVWTPVHLQQEALQARPFYLMTITRPFFYDEFTRAVQQRHPPVYTLRAAGQPVLVIYHVLPLAQGE